MAIGTSFKQQCPSCEALVPVKDVGMVGKKIECPKCKDKFIVKSPTKEKGADEDEEIPKTKANGKAAPAKAVPGKTAPDKKAGQRVAGKAEDEDEDGAEEARKTTARAKKKSRTDDDDEDEEDQGTGKKKTSRFSMGIVLAVVGLVVLAAAAYFLVFKPKGPQTIAKAPTKFGSPPISQNDSAANEDKEKEKEAPKDTGTKPLPVEPALVAANAELTNLLPNDTHHVAHVPFQTLLDQASLRDALSEGLKLSDGGKEDFLRAKLGFSPLAIDDLIRAERYGPGGWSFTVVHFQEEIKQDAVKKALALKPAPLVKNYTHYQVSAPNPWFEQLARVAIGVPRQLRTGPGQEKRALYVHFHNPQTMIFADEAPMVALLKEDKRFKSMSDGPAPVAPAPAVPAQAAQVPDTPAPMAETPEQPPAKPKTKRPKNRPGKTKPKEVTPPTEAKEPAKEEANTAATPPPRMETYVTIKPALKAILDRMESLGTDGRDKILYSSATDLDAARHPDSAPEEAGRSPWSPRLIWDVTLLLHEHNPRLRLLGVALVRKDERIYQLRNELQCPLENDARTLHQDLAEDIAPEVARFISRFLGHKVAVPKKEEALPADPVSPKTRPPGQRPRPGRGAPVDVNVDKEKEALPTASKITVAQNDKIVDFVLDLKLENPEMAKLHGIASLLGCGLRAAMEVAAATATRHELARAGKLLPEKGLSERGVLPGQYPPGAFPRRPTGNSQRFIREPLQRVSWMAGLLPFLGQKTLYEQIHFDQSWRDPSNWVPAATLVPHFLDPAYPASSYYLSRPDLPFELAATHFVGIAGVGLDAADYDPTDPAVINKRGVMSYDKGVSLEEIRAGHGLANTILMLQVPPDNLTGVGPWMAGGGSTLRGVPDKNSVAPFVFSSPGKDGKLRRGTYALMADGSVRFIDQNVSDEVFKAMATAKSPLPDNYDPDSLDSKTPLVKPPKGLEVKGSAAPLKKDVRPPVQNPAKKDLSKEAPPMKTSRIDTPCFHNVPYCHKSQLDKCLRCRTVV